jgi:hypothetical protein
MAVFLKRLDSSDTYEIRQGNRRNPMLLGTVDYRKTIAEELNNNFPIYWNDSISPEKSHSIGSFRSLESASQTILEYARAHAQTFLRNNELFFDLTLESRLNQDKPKRTTKNLKSASELLQNYSVQAGNPPSQLL